MKGQFDYNGTEEDEDDHESDPMSGDDSLVHLTKIFSLQKDFHDASYKLLLCQEETKAVKKLVEAAQDRLNSYIRNLNKAMPLFDKGRE